jgi:hypothetical protein
LADWQIGIAQNMDILMGDARAQMHTNAWSFEVQNHPNLDKPEA